MGFCEAGADELARLRDKPLLEALRLVAPDGRLSIPIGFHSLGHSLEPDLPHPGRVPRIAGGRDLRLRMRDPVFLPL